MADGCMGRLMGFMDWQKLTHVIFFVSFLFFLLFDLVLLDIFL
jgi:hypothetical protein